MVPAVMSDAPALIATLLPSDREEIASSPWRTPERALSVGLKSSVVSWTAKCNGEILGMFGVIPWPGEGEASIWIIAGEPSHRFKKTFYAQAKRALSVLSTQWPVLHLTVAVSDDTGVRLANRLGFEAVWSDGTNYDLMLRT